MKDLAGTLLDEAIKQRDRELPYVRLLEITLPDFEVIRVANYPTDIEFETDSEDAPLVWQAFPFVLGDITETKRGDLPQIQISVCNVTLELMRRFDEAEGLTDQRVRILIVNVETLDDSSARVLYEGDIINSEADQDTIRLDLGKPSLNQAAFPARRCLSECSVIRFTDEACGYVAVENPTETVGGGFSSCNRSLADCRERGDDEVARGLVRLHPKRMDGFPGVTPGND